MIEWYKKGQFIKLDQGVMYDLKNASQERREEQRREEWRIPASVCTNTYEQEKSDRINKSNRHQHWGFLEEAGQQLVGKEKVEKKHVCSM